MAAKMRTLPAKNVIQGFTINKKRGIIMSKWDKIKDQVFALKGNWWGTCLDLVTKLMADKRTPPQDVYLLPDGNIILEWQHEDKRIERIEIEGPGYGQLMISFPNAPAQFSDYIW
jgi:hypothetical protein